MKVILQAFNGKLRGEVMDIPESSGTRWDLILTKPTTTVTGYGGEKIGEHLPLDTRCTFEWTGKIDSLSHARIYEMIDITK